MASLTLIRGLPGSGKTTLAKKLNSDIHLEADMYMMEKGIYVFDKLKLHSAHRWCQTTTEVFLNNDHEVIVSNTFTTKKEIVPYLEIIKRIGCPLYVYRLNKNYGSIHNVPAETIDLMKARFQDWPDEYIMDKD